MTAPDFLPAWPPAANSFLIFGLLLLAGLAGGRLAATTRVLPAITGYIATGFLLGPGVLGLARANRRSRNRACSPNSRSA